MTKKIALYTTLALMFFLGCSKDSDITSGTNPNPNRSANLLTTGASANDILSNDTFDKLLIEIAYVSGFQPTVDAVDTLEEFIKARTFKENVEFKYTQLSSPNEETLTLNEVADLEKENRTAYNNGSTLAIYIYFADAPADSDDESENLVTLGAVYRNTSMVIYETTVRDLASKSVTISVADLEAATLNHEFGHLLGLVNLGTDPVHPEHEDTEIDENDVETGNNHCNVDGCLMRAELQFGGSMLKMMQSNISKGLTTVPQLDAECLLDLQSNGGR